MTARDPRLKHVLASERVVSANERMTARAAKVTWKCAGIHDAGEVQAWLDVGVFDGLRAALLKLAGITAADLASVPDGHRLGFAFALGELSVVELENLLAAYSFARAEPSADGQASHLRVRDRSTAPTSDATNDSE